MKMIKQIIEIEFLKYFINLLNIIIFILMKEKYDLNLLLICIL